MSIFSENLKYLRQKMNLSQNRLSEMANVNQTTIARWESEEISPSLDNIVDLANSLNVTVADLVGVNLQMTDNNINLPKLTPEAEQELLKETLRKKGLLNENDELSDEDLDKLMKFAMANKDFITKKKD